jgi:hypothetical protein
MRRRSLPSWMASLADRVAALARKILDKEEINKAGDGETVTPLLPEPGVWTVMA